MAHELSTITDPLQVAVGLEIARRAWSHTRPMGPLRESEQRVMDIADEVERQPRQPVVGWGSAPAPKPSNVVQLHRKK